MKRIMIVIAIIAAMYTGITNVFAEEPIYVYKTVRITSGDTLWNIASVYAEPGEDIHEVIFNICQWNNLKSKTLYPGQIIKIKVKATDELMLAKK